MIIDVENDKCGDLNKIQMLGKDNGCNNRVVGIKSLFEEKFPVFFISFHSIFLLACFRLRPWMKRTGE